MLNKRIEEMTLVEIARNLAEAGIADKAIEAYTGALKQGDLTAEEKLESACAVLQYGNDYKVAYDAFLSLYRDGAFKEDVLGILTDAFYLPNVKLHKKKYEKNCKLLARYPYLFRKDFLPFAELPIQFYPYDDNGVLPFYKDAERFDEYTDINEPIIRHYFFKDLEKPVLAADVFSQHELEYLRDNVRRSDWVARENHIYLHYTSWGEFCAWLQMLDVKPLLEDEKFVFLVDEEITQYPIDFKERFGIDYSQFPVKPIGIREVNKIVWHTQFFAHCGGDFFNEILHEHPNLFAGDSVIFEDFLELLKTLRDIGQSIVDSKGALTWNEAAVELCGIRLLRELENMKEITLKDALVTIYLGSEIFSKHLDASERVVPALMFQPHFHKMKFNWQPHESGAIEFSTTAFDDIKASGLLEQFKYIKTFTPVRRPTTSQGAIVRFMQGQVDRGYTYSGEDSSLPLILTDVLSDTIKNRTFMVASNNRMFKDSRLVRFEDAKLNPTASFTALAEFLDIPYTESMTYCSDFEGRDPGGIGFNTNSVYRTYDEFCDVHEKKLIEYLLRDIYVKYGYSYQYYDGKTMPADEEEALLEQCQCNLSAIENSWRVAREKFGQIHNIDGEKLDLWMESSLKERLKECKERRLQTVRMARHGLSFCDGNGDKLTLMEPLKLDPALLEQPLYRR